jgi:hypothetical protein
MTRITLFSLLLATAITSCNQKQTTNSKQEKNAVIIEQSDVTLSDLVPKVADNKFPLIHFSKNKKVEDKINTFLEVGNLQHLPGDFKKNPFEKVTKSDGFEPGSLSFDDYTRHETHANILSLSLNETGTGAYTESFETSYNFDLRTGNPILLNNLFTADGLKSITKNVNLSVKQQVEDVLAKLNAPDSKNSPATDGGELDDEISMYETCLQGLGDAESEIYSYYFNNDSITFVIGKCSNHADMALDELGDFYIGFPLSAIKQYLSPYGENLLNNENESLTTNTPEGKLYKGFINGKYPISAMINSIEKDGSFSMYYWYDKTRIPIELNGNFEHQHFSLTESTDINDQYNQTAKIEANWVDNKKITGTWTNSKTSEVLKLELVAY